MKILKNCCWKVLIFSLLGCVNCEECFTVDKPSDVPCVFPFRYMVRNLIIQTVRKTNKVVNVLSCYITYFFPRTQPTLTVPMLVTEMEIYGVLLKWVKMCPMRIAACTGGSVHLSVQKGKSSGNFTNLLTLCCI